MSSFIEGQELNQSLRGINHATNERRLGSPYPDEFKKLAESIFMKPDMSEFTIEYGVGRLSLGMIRPIITKNTP